MSEDETPENEEEKRKDALYKATIVSTPDKDPREPDSKDEDE